MAEVLTGPEPSVELSFLDGISYCGTEACRRGAKVRALACLRGVWVVVAVLLAGEKFLIFSFSRESAVGGRAGGRCLVNT